MADMDLAGQDSDDEQIVVKPIEEVIDRQNKSATTNQMTSSDGGQYPMQAKHSLPLQVQARDSLMMYSDAKPGEQTFADASLEGNLHLSALSKQ